MIIITIQRFLFFLCIFVVCTSVAFAYSMASSTYTGSSGLGGAGSTVSSSTYTGSFSGGSTAGSFSSSTYTGSVSSASNRRVSTSSSSTTTSTASSSSGGGGGGSGASSASGVFDYDEWLVSDSSLEVVVNNTPYKIDIDAIRDIDATLSYNDQIYTLPLGENVFIDLTGDGSDDIKIKLMDIVPSVRIRLGASLLHDASGSIAGEVVFNETVVPEEIIEEQTATPETSDTEESITAEDDTLTLSLGDEFTEPLASDADLALDEFGSALLSNPARNGLIVLAVAAAFLCLFFFRHQLLSLLRKRE